MGQRETYKKAYLYLYGKITDEIRCLQEIQRGVEDIFLQSDAFDQEIHDEDAAFCADFAGENGRTQCS